MTVTVGPVRDDELDAFVASVTGLFREDAGAHDPVMDVTWPVREGRAYYGGLLADDGVLLAVARDGDRVVGHLVGKTAGPDDLRLERIAVLESMRVDPDARGRGAAAALIDHFLAWARTRDARHASVTAYAANTRAQHVYHRHGFTPMSTTLRTPL